MWNDHTGDDVHLKIGFDLDGVVVDSLPEMILEGQRIGCIPDHIVASDVNGKIEDQFQISFDDMRRILTLEVYRRSEPVTSVCSDIAGWMTDGHEIHYITSRFDGHTPGVETVTAEWLDRHGLYRGCGGLHHVRSTKKWETIMEIGISTFVDDMPHVIRTMLGVVPHPFLLAVDHNSWVDGDMRRWMWDEIRSEIDRLSVDSTSCRSMDRIGVGLDPDRGDSASSAVATSGSV